MNFTTIELDADAIRRLLPHRDVMALLDRIECYEPEQRKITAVKRVASNEFSMQNGQLRAIFPPTLLVECLAQTCGIMMNMEGLERKGVELTRLPDRAYRTTIPAVPLSVLAESHVKHESYAGQGDSIRLQARVSMQRGDFRYFEVSAMVGDRLLAKGTILLSYPTYM